jgi:hypothetical protein
MMSRINKPLPKLPMHELVSYDEVERQFQNAKEHFMRYGGPHQGPHAGLVTVQDVGLAYDQYAQEVPVQFAPTYNRPHVASGSFTHGYGPGHLYSLFANSQASSSLGTEFNEGIYDESIPASSYEDFQICHSDSHYGAVHTAERTGLYLLPQFYSPPAEFASTEPYIARNVPAIEDLTASNGMENDTVQMLKARQSAIKLIEDLWNSVREALTLIADVVASV